MPSPFAAATNAAAAAVDSYMGERFEYRPMKRAADVDARTSVDTGRVVVLDLLAMWGDPSARDMSAAAREPGVKPEYPGHASTRPYIALELSRLPYAPVKGDIVVRKDTGDRFKVAEVLPSSPGFARLDLNEMRTPA